jgi:hypothetical protein
MPNMSMGLQLQVEAIYSLTDHRGNVLLHDVIIRGEKKNSIQRIDHRWLNGARSGWPGDVPEGSKIRFFASPLYRRGGARLTDVRQVEVI